MARVSEPAHPVGRFPGRAAPAKSGGQVLPGAAPAPAREAAFKQTPGRSTNKTVVRGESAFKTRGGKGNAS
jgi:hypothetical protein